MLCLPDLVGLQARPGDAKTALVHEHRQPPRSHQKSDGRASTIEEVLVHGDGDAMVDRPVEAQSKGLSASRTCVGNESA